MERIETFGETADGDKVERVEIAGGGLRARIISWGAVLQDLRLQGHGAPLVLGFEEFSHYPAYSPSFGAIPGRFANRIRNGHFVLDGEAFELDRNQDGKHTLHGGSKGFGKRLWTLAGSGDDFVTLKLRSPSGDMGFPGNLDATCTYRLAAPNTLVIELTATADQPTVCNLTNHSYFNLDDGGAGDILDHRVTIDAGAYLPNDADSVPTGVVLPVDETPYDFRLGRPVRSEEATYDNNFCLTSSRGPLRRTALVQGVTSGIEMEMWTTEPGVQFYAGHKIRPTMPAGLAGITYGPSSGLCLEAQLWPDAPNRPYFPSAVLRPGETYRHVTEFRFG